MKSIKKFAAITIAAGGLAVAGGGMAFADTPQAQGGALMSPGIVSGNNVQVPVHAPVNACGNTVTVIGLLNSAFGTPCDSN